jgi:inosine/xanthosine triphosphate pyrophosphatase family protein/dephospho-CoA kinase
MIDRPSPREVFLTADRRLDVYFYTSNLPKYYQAVTVLSQFGLTVRHFKSRQEPYSEDYSLGKQALLRKAVSEIVASVGRSSLFFVEDTSVRVEALSNDIDVPGLSVKEWFASTTFEQLDDELFKLGNDRRAVVKSDIALHVPGLIEPIYFRGETRGLVAPRAYLGPERPQYPWLSPNTFNGWFIPDGCNKTLAEMSLDESWSVDFRIASLVQMVDRLTEYAAVLNLPAQAYSRRRKSTFREQLSLTPVYRPTFVVVGRICAGKTTFGERAVQAHGMIHVEASRVVQTLKDEAGVPKQDPFHLAAAVLDRLGSDAVALKIVQLYEAEIPSGLVITGFRTLEEIEAIRREVPHAQLILVEASDRVRFHRHLARGRVKGLNTFDAFIGHDQQQASFGLLNVAQDFADIRIVNEGSIQEYWEQIDSVISGDSRPSVGGVSYNVRPRYEPYDSQLARCLRALSLAGRPLDCNEIEQSVRQEGKEIRSNNANQILKALPELAKRLELRGRKVRYEITKAGETYLRLVRERHPPNPPDSHGPTLFDERHNFRAS